jgi:hypothetical protein
LFFLCSLLDFGNVIFVFFNGVLVIFATAQKGQKVRVKYLGIKGQIIRIYFSFICPKRLCHISNTLSSSKSSASHADRSEVEEEEEAEVAELECSALSFSS